MLSDVKFNFFVGKILSLNCFIIFKFCDFYLMMFYGFYYECKVGVVWYIFEGCLGCYKMKKNVNVFIFFIKKLIIKREGKSCIF